MKYLSRNKVYEKHPVCKDAKKLYIFCEGSVTEICYLKYFQGFSSNIDIIPIPCNNGQTDPVKLKESAENMFFTPHSSVCLSEEFGDEVWFVIDTDRWNEGGKIQQLKTFCELKDKGSIRWQVAQSNPAFELWLYYHFYSEKPINHEVKSFTSFKEYVNSKIPGGFDSRSMPIELEAAINNSLANFSTLNGQPCIYSTEMHNLGILILPFVKEQLIKAKKRCIDNS